MKKYFLLFLCVLSSQLLMAQTVGPLIKTQWDQVAPYNSMCPEIDGQHCLASCGAAAMAQICYYYRWPENGMGEGYWHFDGGEHVYVDLSQDIFEYDKMLLTYDENSSEESIQAVALLMRDVAFHNTVFTLTESSSPSTQMLALDFGYDKGIMHIDHTHCSLEDIKAIIRFELDAGRPVLVNGSNGSAGHTFICDGYRENDEYHFNYGWGGQSDGWSTLENCLFPISLSIDYNIKKDEGGKSGFTLGADKDFKWEVGNMLHGSYRFHSYMPWDTQFEMALAVENKATSEVQYLYPESVKEGKFDIEWNLDADLADGDYVLYPAVHDAAYNSAWKKSYFRELCQKEVLLTVKDGVKTFTNATIVDPVRDGAIEVNGICYVLNDGDGTASVTYRNDKYGSYKGNITVPATITVNDKTYTVASIGDNAFNECHYLGNVIIGKNVVEIKYGVFNECVADKIAFEEGSKLETIDQFAFYNCNIKEIVLPEGLTTIGRTAFANSRIGSVTIPSTVTTWGAHCFDTQNLICVHVNSTIPPAIEQCFRTNGEDRDYPSVYNADTPYGISATVLYVPAGTKDAYAKADVWKEFGFFLDPGDDDSFVSHMQRDAIEIDGILYEVNGNKGIAKPIAVLEDMTDVVFKGSFKLGDKTINVTRIGGVNESILSKDYNSVVVPINVETLGRGFLHSATIGSVIFEEGSHLKTIEASAFDFLTIKSPLVLPEGLETIEGLYLFDADVTIPVSVTTIENLYLPRLQHFRVSWTTPISAPNLFDPDQFQNGNNINRATLHVPEGTKELYAAAEGWKQFKRIVGADEPDIITYTITYTGVDEATFPGGIIEEYTEETETFSLQEPVREGYVFIGWTYEGQEEPTLTVTIAKGSTGDRTFAANWRVIEEPEPDPELDPELDLTSVTIEIGNSGKTTYTGMAALDFSGFDDLKAYVATGYEIDGTIWLTRIKQVPANTPILIKGEADKAYEVPVMEQCTAYFKNLFRGNAYDNLTISATAYEGLYKNFYMSGGVFKPASDNYSLKAGKCYLQVPASFGGYVEGNDQKVTISSSGKSSYAPSVDVDLTTVEGLKAYAATGYDPASQTIWLTRVFKIQALEGVLLKGEPGVEYTLPAAKIQAYYDNMFVGNLYEKITINETSDNGYLTNFYLANGQFRKVSGTREIGVNKSYLQLPTSLLVSSSSARGKKDACIDELFMDELETETLLLGSIGGDDEDGTTRINAIATDNAQLDVYYNLQGQRVDNPKKGLYIKNGKKVVIK